MRIDAKRAFPAAGIAYAIFEDWFTVARFVRAAATKSTTRSRSSGWMRAMIAALVTLAPSAKCRCARASSCSMSAVRS
jgi:hypothetical protein